MIYRRNCEEKPLLSSARTFLKILFLLSPAILLQMLIHSVVYDGYLVAFTSPQSSTFSCLRCLRSINTQNILSVSQEWSPRSLKIMANNEWWPKLNDLLPPLTSDHSLWITIGPQRNFIYRERSLSHNPSKIVVRNLDYCLIRSLSRKSWVSVLKKWNCISKLRGLSKARWVDMEISLRGGKIFQKLSRAIGGLRHRFGAGMSGQRDGEVRGRSQLLISHPARYKHLNACDIL
jgi:hypothetical protein